MAITLVQSNPGAQASKTASFLGANTVGNFLVCAARTNNGTLTDSVTNTWVRAIELVNSDGIAIFYVASAKGGTPTVTLSGTGEALCLAEFSGLSATPFAEALAHAQSSATGAAFNSGSITTVDTASMLLIGAVSNETANFLTTNTLNMTAINNASGNTFLAYSVAAAGSHAFTGNYSTSVNSTAAIAAFSAPVAAPGTGAYFQSPIPVTVTNIHGFSWPITSPTLTSGQLGRPTSVCFCDPNGNEYTVTGSTAGAFTMHPLPVVLCNSSGQPLTAPFVFTSGSNAITVTSTKTGNRMGSPVPVVATDQRGNIYTASGFSLGNFVANPAPICLTDTSGNVLTLSGVTT